MIFINPRLLKISKFISNFFNPIISLILYFFYYNIKNNTLADTAKKFFVLLLIVIIPVVVWIYKRVKNGKYTNMDVSDRKQRQSLYIMLISSTLVFVLVNYFIQGSIDWAVLFLSILLIVLKLSNYIIKSSMHTGLNIYVAALFFLQNQTIGILWLLLSVIIAITRLILKRHTVKEVFSGAIISIIISYIYISLTYSNIIN